MAEKKDTVHTPLETNMAFLEGKPYRVMDFPYDEVEKKGPHILRKGMAYRINTDMTKGLFPYRGIIDLDEHWSSYQAPVGIYFKETKSGKYKMRIAYPHSKKEKQEYSLDREQSIMAGVINQSFALDQFTNISSSIGVDGEAFMPPIHVDDDFLNTILKTAIRLKEAPFEPYGKRLEALAVDRSKGVEGQNIRNNSKRAVVNNKACSASKFRVYTDVWGLEAVIIVRDAPDAEYRMFPDDSALVLFTNGIPFEIKPEKLIDVSEYVSSGIANSNRTDESEED